jgi:hypothetical protein
MWSTVDATNSVIRQGRTYATRLTITDASCIAFHLAMLFAWLGEGVRLALVAPF